MSGLSIINLPDPALAYSRPFPLASAGGFFERSTNLPADRVCGEYGHRRDQLAWASPRCPAI